MKWLSFLIAFLPFACSAFSVGVVSDIHAGSAVVRETSKTTVYPSLAIDYFNEAMKEMKALGVDLVISLGDNTNSGEKDYYYKLKEIEDKYGIKILWVKGNHDSKYESILAPNNYTYSFLGTTFNVVDDNSCGKHCFKKKLSGILLQHIPPFSFDSCKWKGSYKNERNNIIFAGHWHKEKTCGKVRIFSALAANKKINFKIINL